MLQVGACALGAMLLSGCGITKMQDATDQLVLSDAVDHSIAAIDFRPLTGHKVYLDTTYIKAVKSVGFVNSDYIISSLRQQVVAAGCHLQDSLTDADLVIEVRCGTLGADGHSTTYGIPANNAVSAAAQALPQAPSVPTLPEISFARRESNEGAAKIAAFAYDRETRAPVWQSGTSQAKTSAKDTWVLGIGPFQGGTVRESTRLAGADIAFGDEETQTSPVLPLDRPPVDFTAQVYFDEGWPLMRKDRTSQMLIGPVEKSDIAQKPEETEVAQAGFEAEKKKDPEEKK